MAKLRPHKPSAKKRSPASSRRSVAASKKTKVYRLKLPIGFSTHLRITIERVHVPRRRRGWWFGLFIPQNITLNKRLLLSVMLIVGGLSGFIFFAGQTIQSHSPLPAAAYAPPAPQMVKPKAKTADTISLPKSEPTHLKAPSVGIDVPLSSVGRKSDGTMEVPPLGVHIAGWYQYSPTPGEVGPSVIAGHVDTYKGPSVFWNLYKLKPGDIVEVSRKDGKTAKFKVDGVQKVPQDNFPTDKVYGPIDHAGLRLITCGGTFNRITQEYDHNTVVFATLMPGSIQN